MPVNIISCLSLPPATIKSVPIFDYARAKNEELANMSAEIYHACCGKGICGGCVYSLCGNSGNSEKCPFCRVEIMKNSDNERLQEMMKRVEANDAGAIHELGCYYYNGEIGLLQDQAKAMQLWTLAVKHGSSKAHYNLGNVYHEGGDIKKAKFHYGAAAMAGHEIARYNLGQMELGSGNMERAVKHWKTAASAGDHKAMHNLRINFEQGNVSRETIESTLEAYNNACAEMRSEARDAYLSMYIDSIGGM
jgi:TPR repeat protein